MQGVGPTPPVKGQVGASAQRKLDPRPPMHFNQPTGHKPDSDVDAPSVHTKPDWLDIARQSYSTSTDWLSTNHASQWQRSWSQFHSQHPDGSKYKTPDYARRAKHFRPRARASLTQIEAMAAVAFFSHPDYMNIEGELASSEEQQIAAEVMSNLLHERLDNDLHWYLTVLGALQTSSVVGAVCSYVGWELIERPEYSQAIDPVSGETILTDAGEPAIDVSYTTITDRPSVELVELPNFRFHPASKWYNVVDTSPFTIERVPMHVQDVQNKVRNPDDKIPWHQVGEGSLLASLWAEDTLQHVRSARDQNREDRYNNQRSLKEFDVVDVRRTIVRRHHRDWLYYTLGNNKLLSDPIPLEEVETWLKPGERPYVMGGPTVEAHSPLPKSTVAQGEEMLNMINTVTNLRVDTIGLSLTPRYLVNSKADVDTRALERPIPGGWVHSTNPEEAVRLLETPNIGRTSFEEQDRLQNEYDDIQGVFNNNGVQSNRQMNETVGGMQMMRTNSNMTSEYRLKTLGITWMRPVLRKLLRLEARYETDQRVLAIAGDKAKLMPRYGIDEVQDWMLQQDLVLDVNVGFGATDPLSRVSMLMQGIGNLAGVGPEALSDINMREVQEETIARIGLDVNRFMKPEEEQVDPQVQELEAMLQEMQAIIEGKQIEHDQAIEIANISSGAKMYKDELDHLAKRIKLLLDNETAQDKRSEVELKQRDQDLAETLAEIDVINSERDRLTHDRERQEDREDSKTDDMMPGKSGVIARNDYGKLPGRLG